MAEFAKSTVAEALERALAAATHLTERDAAAVAAARALADKIDAWDVIVEWAIDDASQIKGGRPAVPANDNVSLPSFLKYLDALQLIPPAEKAKPGPVSSASPAQLQANAMRDQIAKGALALVPEVG